MSRISISKIQNWLFSPPCKPFRFNTKIFSVVESNLGVERHSIAKAVKNATGLTFREFRNNALLKRAGALLKDESNRTVKEVAFAMGYRSQGSLSRFIRAVTGHSAKELRNGKA